MIYPRTKDAQQYFIHKLTHSSFRNVLESMNLIEHLIAGKWLEVTPEVLKPRACPVVWPLWSQRSRSSSLTKRIAASGNEIVSCAIHIRLFCDCAPQPRSNARACAMHSYPVASRKNFPRQNLTETIAKPVLRGKRLWLICLSEAKYCKPKVFVLTVDSQINFLYSTSSLIFYDLH